MMQEYQVVLEEVRFFAFHGLFPEERILGNWFVLTVRVAKNRNTMPFDHIGQTFDYGVIYGICKEVMSEPVDLLETVADRIAGRLKLSFEDITKFEIHLKKENPPLGMLQGSSRVSIIEQIGL